MFLKTLANRHRAAQIANVEMQMDKPYALVCRITSELLQAAGRSAQSVRSALKTRHA